ncbi:DUF6670 family protein [Acinetobacter rudis]|uniref:Uncharacterized protein n=1 Tax=Acinetobacter rudis TaxID=632955 RepID=A0AAW8JCK6_9GAMM|nr:DUF6670 family protein [Acinetobacter rudis]MDQ8936588.1 hypothetical protein [Acinetobacter rudis]MDQ9016908.1 hypothetical protein [Acinetobacter rudis]
MKLPKNSQGEQLRSTQAQFALNLAYQPPTRWFKITQQSLVITGLPAPLHYYNFKAQNGQPNIPIFNQSQNKKKTLDTVTTLNSVSSHMLEQSAQYSLEQECLFRDNDYQFGKEQRLKGEFPFFEFIRKNSELSVELNICTLPVVSHFAKLKYGLGLYQHWSLLCRCKGELIYKGQKFEIDHLGNFEYARGVNIPFLALYFYTYQIIQLKDRRQLILVHIRNQYNHVLHSRIYIRAENSKNTICFNHRVEYKIFRVYPKVQTPYLNYMYLPREFKWFAQQGKHCIEISAQSRGDYKAGLGRGFVGSFQYQIKIDDYYEEGSAGYCEFIDLRPLNWQEIDQPEQKLKLNSLHSSVLCKKK